jgi:hypothetical protein
MVMPRDHNAGRNHSIKIDNISIERAEAFKYFGTTLTDQICIHEIILSRSVHSVQNHLSSSLLSKALKNLDIRKTIILFVFFAWVLNLVADIVGGT